jgi:hypothetical protein
MQPRLTWLTPWPVVPNGMRFMSLLLQKIEDRITRHFGLLSGEKSFANSGTIAGETLTFP